MEQCKLEFLSEKYSPLDTNSNSKITFLQDSAEVVTVKNSGGSAALSGIKRISKNQYKKVETGEVFNYNTNTNRTDNTISIKNSLKKLRVLIKNNFVELESFLVTLTYKDEMFEFSKAVQDYTEFYKKLKKHYNYYRFEYLRIIEPTAKGEWHIHVLFKLAEKVDKFYISQEKIQSIWGHGSVKVRQVYNVEGVEKYFCTYSNGGKALTAKVKPKYIKKQERWKYYPYRARIFAKSNGIIYPQTLNVKRNQVDEILKGYKQTSANTLLVRNIETGKVLNKVNYEHYKKR